MVCIDALLYSSVESSVCAPPTGHGPGRHAYLALPANAGATRARPLPEKRMHTYKLAGQGNSKVLLLPGLMGTQQAFDAMLALADLERFQYAVLDYRGYGASRQIEGSFSLEEMAADAGRLLDQLGWQRCSVAGHSIGALVAQLLALARPRQVRALVSLAGHAGDGSPVDPQRLRMLRGAASDLLLHTAMVERGSGSQYGAGFARAVALASWGQIAPAAFERYAVAAASADLAPLVAGSRLPLLAIVGQCDPQNTVQKAEAGLLQWYGRGRLEIFAGVGHYPMIEVPARTVAAIERFAAATAEALDGTGAPALP